MDATPDVNAPPAYGGPQEEQSYSLVLLSGLATTALTLLGVYLLDVYADDFHIMGWYADYVLPVGALIVGLAASSGYGLASWFSGIKITRSLLWMVLGFQFLAYFGAQYIEFKGMKLVHRNSGKPVGFLEYYDYAARSFAWKQRDGSPGQPLGIWGYAFRGLELAGFLGGSLIVPVLLRKAPYCQACRRYMNSRQLGLIAASVPSRKVKKSDEAAMAAYIAEHDQAFETGKRTWETLKQFAVDSKAPDFKKALGELEPGKKAAIKLPRRFSLKLVRCKRCCSGWLHVHVLMMHGNRLQATEFARVDLHPEFVRNVQS